MLYTSILHHHSEVSCVMMRAFRDTLPPLPQVASPAPVLQQATLTLELWWGTVPGGVGFTVLCRHLLSLWVHALCAHSCVKFQLRGNMVSETNHTSLGNPISWVFSDECGFIVQIIDASFEELSPLVERAVHPLLGKAWIHMCYFFSNSPQSQYLWPHPHAFPLMHIWLKHTYLKIDPTVQYAPQLR